MSQPATIVTASYRLGQFLFGSRIAQDEDHNSQFETIFIAYVLNALVVGVLLIVSLTVIGAFDPTQVPLSSRLGVVIAASNVLALVLTYFWSLSWTANQDMIARLRSLAEARGYYYSLFVRFVVPVALLIGAVFSFLLIVGLFSTVKLGLLHPLTLGNLLASIAWNVMHLQAVFVRRSVRDAETRPDTHAT
jgi:hypothetical protein